MWTKGAPWLNVVLKMIDLLAYIHAEKNRKTRMRLWVRSFKKKRSEHLAHLITTVVWSPIHTQNLFWFYYPPMQAG